MKKIISILVVIALLMSLTVSAFAAETPTLTVSSAEAQVGDEVTLEVTISEATFAAFGLTITYDSEALELTAVTKEGAMNDFFGFNGSKKSGKVTAFHTEDMDVEGVIFTMTFNVLAAGEHTVGLEIDSFNLADQSVVEVTAVAGTISVAGEEEPELPEGALCIGDNKIELPRGATEASVYTFTATETGTLYVAASNFLYESAYTEGYEEDYYGQDHFIDNTIFTFNGETLENGFYGAVEVVAGEVYTISWEHNGSTYGYMVTLNLSYTDENLPVPGIDMNLRPADLPRDTVVIPAGGEQMYILSSEFEGYVLQIFGENVYLYYQTWDWMTGEQVEVRIDAVDGVLEYVFNDHYATEILIGNAGAEDASFPMDVYAPLGSEHNPIIVENLEDIYTVIAAGTDGYVYFQWTSDKLGTIITAYEDVNIYFYNQTKAESGEYSNNYTTYSGYVEPGDVLLIGISVYDEVDREIFFEYTFDEGYRQGSEQNPIEADLIAGLEVTMSNKTVFYSWTPEQNMVVTLGFEFLYSWSSNLPTITINGVEYTLGEELTVTAGEPVIFSLTAGTGSVYGTLQATVISTEEPPVEEPEVIYEGEMVVETTDTYGYFDMYTLNAPVTGTYTFYIPAGLGVWSYDSYMSWGQPEIDFYANEEGFELVVELTEGEEFSFFVGATTKSQWTITYTVVASEGDQGGDDPIEDDYTYQDLTIGNNNVNAADIHWTYTAPEAGTLVLNAGAAIMGDVEVTVRVNDGEPQALAAMGQLVLELQAGDVVKINVFASGYMTITAEWETEGDEPIECEHEYVDGVCIHCGEEDPNYVPPTEEPDGSYGNPFIIEEMPFTAEHENISDDFYYQWTATEEGVLYVNAADGVFTLNSTSGASSEYTETGKSIIVAAGDVITINYWSGTGFTAEFVAGTVEAEPGTEGNPIVIDTLNITLTTADDGIYYAWTATEAGEIVIRVAECTWSYGYSLTVNGQSLYGEGAELTLNVEAGDQVIIVIVVYPSASSDGHLTLEQVVEEEHECEFVITDSKDATCTEDGYVTYTCECGETYTETVPATGHSFVDGACENCGEADPDYVPECEHEYVDGVCTNCGEADPNYNPNTGSMNVLAIALIAMMSVTAVVVTASKKED